jgi:hypothetical protein
MEKIKKNETTHNNFFEILNNIHSNENLPLESHRKETLKIPSTDKQTSMNNLSNMRPNTADVDCKIVFQRGHRMFNKGMKMYGPTKEIEEKKETVNNHPPMKRAGTSNLLFRKTSKNGKRNTEFNQNQENNVKPGGFHFNLF